MWLRRKRKVTEVNDRAAKGIAGFILKLQNRFAIFLGNRTKKFSKRGNIVLFSLFLLVFGGNSVFTLLKVFIESRGAYESLKPANIQFPRYDNDPDTGLSTSPFTIPENIMDKIKVYRTYMDSLRQTREGIRIHDSILRARPNLTDSIDMLEKLYYQQHKK